MKLFDPETAVFMKSEDGTRLKVSWNRPDESNQPFPVLTVEFLIGEHSQMQLIEHNLNDSDTESSMIEASMDAENWAVRQMAN